MFGLYRCVRFVAGPIVKALFRVRVEGMENIPAEGPIIIASKHTTYADPIYHALVNKRVLRSMAKKELFKNGFLKWVMGQAGAFPVRRGQRDRSAIDLAVEFLQEGQAVLIFPEGTRSRKELGEFKNGAIMLSSMTGASIVPAAIVAPRGYNLFAGMTIKYGAPVNAEELGAKRLNSASQHGASEQLRGRVKELLGEVWYS